MPQEAPQSHINPPTGPTPPRPVPTNAPANDNEPETESGATRPAPPIAANDNEQQKQQQPRPRRLTNIDIGLMLVVAVLFDLIGIIPVVGEITSTVLAAMTFGLWFVIKYIPLISPKKIAAWGLPLIAEAIPALSEVTPGVTIGVLIVIIMTVFEDKTGIEVMSLAKGKAPDLAAVERHISSQMETKLKGATPTASTQSAPARQPQTGPTPVNDNPVIAAQEDHFADPSQPAPQQGATPSTPPPQSRPRRVERRQETNPQDEEVATTNKTRPSVDSLSQDRYREDPYALETDTQERLSDTTVVGEQKPANDNRPETFPGTSPQFGRGGRQQGQVGVERKRAPGAIYFDLLRKAAGEKPKDEEIPKGATPVPESENKGISSQEQIGDNKNESKAA